MIHDGQFDLHVRLIYIYTCVYLGYLPLQRLRCKDGCLTGGNRGRLVSKFALCGPLRMFLIDSLPIELGVEALIDELFMIAQHGKFRT